VRKRWEHESAQIEPRSGGICRCSALGLFVIAFPRACAGYLSVAAPRLLIGDVVASASLAVFAQSDHRPPIRHTSRTRFTPK